MFRRIIKHMRLQQYHNKWKCKSKPTLLRLNTFVLVGGVGGLALTNTPADVVDDAAIPYMGGAVRFLRSMKIAIVVSLDYSFSKIGLAESSPNYGPMMSRIHQRCANRILNGCLKNGGTYIKLGQGLACMNHVLPVEYTETLKELQDKCLKRRPEELRELFLEDFGTTPEKMYKCFNTEPIAAASLAQVFKATTKDGQKVAVKVQYIDLRSRFKSDIATVEFLLNLIGKIHSDFNFAWIMADLKDSLKQELNFIHEAENAERCAKDLSHLSFIHVPKIMWDLCTTRVLVTEFIDGYKISDVDQLNRNGFSLIDIDTKLFQAFGEQIFQTGFVHADPHPGNILIRKQNGTTQLVLLDHGLYETVSRKDRLALSHMWKAIIFNDHYNMQKYSKELGVEDYTMFAEILTQVPLRSKNFKLITKVTEEDLKYMKEFAQNKIDNVMKVLKNMPSTLLLILRNLNTIRAIAQEHGDPIDRYKVLARCATKEAFDTRHSIFKTVLNAPVKLYFEIRLMTNKLSLCLQKLLLKVLYLLGRSPDATFLMEPVG